TMKKRCRDNGLRGGMRRAGMMAAFLAMGGLAILGMTISIAATPLPRRLKPAADKAPSRPSPTPRVGPAGEGETVGPRTSRTSRRCSTSGAQAEEVALRYTLDPGGPPVFTFGQELLASDQPIQAVKLPRF